MSSVLNFYWAATLTRDGQTKTIAGSLTEPQKSTTLPDGTNVLEREFSIAAGATNQEVWSWLDTGGFEAAIFWVPDGEGYLNFALQFDTPTSESNQEPAETTPRWSHRNISCFMPACFDTDRAYTHATAGTVAGDSVGTPTLWADGSKVLGVAAKAMVRNPGTDAVKVRAIVIQ